MGVKRESPGLFETTRTTDMRIAEIANSANVIATSTGTVANQTATFTNFAQNTGVDPGIATKFGFTSNGGGAIPANEVVGFYVTFTPSTKPV